MEIKKDEVRNVAEAWNEQFHFNIRYQKFLKEEKYIYEKF